MPYLLKQLDCPVCRQCGLPMAFITQVPLKSPLVLSDKFDMAYVFMCCEYHEPDICDSYDPFSGANAVFFQRGDQGHFACKEADKFPEYGFELEEFAEPIVDTADPEFHNVPRDPAREAAAAKHGILFGLHQDDFPEPPEQVGSLTKLGGVPCWVQNNDAIPCPQCGGEMDLIAQIASSVVWPEVNMHHSRRVLKFIMSLEGQDLRDSGKHVLAWIDDDGYEFELVDPDEERTSGGITIMGNRDSVKQKRSEEIFPFGDAGVAYIFKCLKECSPTSSGAFLWQTG